MIFIKRSKDFHNDVFWIAHDLNEADSRCRQLYLGKNVNGAIEAAVAAGLSKEDAVKQAQSEIARQHQTVDTIA